MVFYKNKGVVQVKFFKFMVMTVLTIFIFAGCSTKAASYKDGTYDIMHKSTKPGYEEAVVTIQNGKMQTIDLKRLDDNKVEVDYNQWDGTGEYPNLKKDRVDLANAMLSKQSPDVDTISGATQSCNGWIAAVKDALKQASQK
jgi:uncharacterized protein with FMN-binding domain